MQEENNGRTERHGHCHAEEFSVVSHDIDVKQYKITLDDPAITPKARIAST